MSYLPLLGLLQGQGHLGNIHLALYVLCLLLTLDERWLLQIIDSKTNIKIKIIMRFWEKQLPVALIDLLDPTPAVIILPGVSEDAVQPGHLALYLVLQLGPGHGHQVVIVSGSLVIRADAGQWQYITPVRCHLAAHWAKRTWHTRFEDT